MQEEIDEADAALQRTKHRETAAQTAIDSWVNAQTAPTLQRNRRQGDRHDCGTFSGNAAARLTNEQLNSELEKAKQTILEKGNAHRDALKKLDEFQQDHYTSYEEFKDLGLEVARPIVEEYKRLFISPSGDYSTCAADYMACRALNPLVAADMGDEELKDALDGLSCFGFDELRSAAIKDLVEEILKYRAAIHSTSDSFWSEVEGAAKYDHDLAKKKEEHPGKFDHHTW